MKLKKYQFKTDFLDSETNSQQNNFIFREFEHYACWIFVASDLLDIEPANNQSVLEQIMADFAANPTMSKKLLYELLARFRRRFSITDQNQVRKLNLLLIVTNYAKVVGAVTGDFQLYQIRNGCLRLKSNQSSLLNRLKPPKSKAIRWHTSYLHNGDHFLICNAKISETSLRGITNFSDPIESMRLIKDGLLADHPDQNLFITFISANKIRHRSFSDDLKAFKSADVIIPVMFMACFGMLAVYAIENRKIDDILLIPPKSDRQQQQIAKLTKAKGQLQAAEKLSGAENNAEPLATTVETVYEKTIAETEPKEVVAPKVVATVADKKPPAVMINGETSTVSRLKQSQNGQTVPVLKFSDDKIFSVEAGVTKPDDALQFGSINSISFKEDELLKFEPINSQPVVEGGISSKVNPLETATDNQQLSATSEIPSATEWETETESELQSGAGFNYIESEDLSNPDPQSEAWNSVVPADQIDFSPRATKTKTPVDNQESKPFLSEPEDSTVELEDSSESGVSSGTSDSREFTQPGVDKELSTLNELGVVGKQTISRSITEPLAVES